MSVSPDTLTRLPPEKELLQCVTTAARVLGWRLVYHTHDSRHSAAGFVDLVIVRPGTTETVGRALFIELKRDARQRLTAEQAAWARALLSAGLDWRRWNWEDWHSGEIEAVLKGA